MKTYTQADADRIRAVLDSMPELATEVSTKEEACSMAAINLGLTGKLTDKTPDCMSEVIGGLVRPINDAMYDTIRDSREWRELLPLAAGTGREHEQERIDIVLTWLWEDVLSQLQPLADSKGFGKQWRNMTEERTEQAAKEAKAAAKAADAIRIVLGEHGGASNEAGWAASWAVEAIRIVLGEHGGASNEAGWAAAYAVDAAAWAKDNAADAADAAGWSAWRSAMVADDIQDFWVRADPVSLLRRLIQVSPPKWEE